MAKSVINQPQTSWFTSPTGVTVMGRTKKYATYGSMLASYSPAEFSWVTDATDDPTVGRGSALYYYDKNNRKYVKLYETEAMDSDGEVVVSTQWTQIEGRPNSSAADIDQAVTLCHVHSNNSVLNSLGGSGIALTVTSGQTVANIITDQSTILTTISTNISSLQSNVSDIQTAVADTYRKSVIDAITTRVETLEAASGDISTITTLLDNYQLKADAFSGNYNDLTNTPNISQIALAQVTWGNLQGKPTLSTVATTGQYSDLIGIPSTLSGGYATRFLRQEGESINLTSNDWAIVFTNGCKLILPANPSDGTSIKISIMRNLGLGRDPSVLLADSEGETTFVFNGAETDSIDLDIAQCFTMIYTNNGTSSGWWVIEKANL